MKVRSNGSDVYECVNKSVGCGNHNNGRELSDFPFEISPSAVFNRARITLAVKRLGNQQLGRAKRLENNIKKNVKKTRCKGGSWTQVPQGHV